MSSARENQSRPIILLGPQRLKPTLGSVLRDRAEGPLGLITAGWEERESEDTELREHVGREVINLELHRRTAQVFRQTPELLGFLRDRRDRLRDLQDLYRLRLARYLQAARELMRKSGNGGLLEEERRSAIATVRQLDEHHLQRISEVRAEFDAENDLVEPELLLEQREKVAELVQNVAVIAVAGGHVGVLLNRLRLFHFLELLGDRLLVAWSAGAMVLSARIVLFHDHPPQGFGNPEVWERGLGLCPGIVALPHARQRLRLEDPVRVALLAQRFAPDACFAMDEGAHLRWRDSHWEGGCPQLAVNGTVEEVAAS